MKKIPTIFKRNQDSMQFVTSAANPECAWVFYGEGKATRKYDGTCCRVKDGKLWKRREIKRDKPYPENFEIADYDGTTGKTVGWVPVDPESREDRWHVEAFGSGNFSDGTYELCGPKIQGNPEEYGEHFLINHANAEIYPNVLRTYKGLQEFLHGHDIEGIVFHHPDGRMAKIKKRDFGMQR